MPYTTPKKAETLAQEAYVAWRGSHTFENFAPAAWEQLSDGWRDSYVAVAKATQRHERKRANENS